jgi:cellulose synthase/poly-beta-1,6-N-acetylglucosamine synthase-like glycosyltransferase
VVEADDQPTAAAVARQHLPPHFEVVSVPAGRPRTKPKALAYALAFARGDYVVVFDAEDRPEPDQLRRAAAAFRDSPGVGCFQARLTPDNRDSLLTRLFALEYAANFDVLLPALASWRVPLPLGGTSNHFPRRVLDEVGGWDPFNVTEDADLGIRLARFGYRSAVLNSRTYEEAPVRLSQWLPQRRRWLKGWMQTACICMPGRVPDPLRLSFVHQLAVQAVLTGGVIGLLLYPLSLAGLALALTPWADGRWPDSALGWALIAVNACNFGGVLVAATVSALRGLRRTGAWWLAWLLPLLPFYWALMSFAAWQAAVQFLRDPSRWEKTRHGVARQRQAVRVEAASF